MGEVATTKGNALEQIASRLSVEPNILKQTLMATVIKGIKTGNNSYRAATEAEVVSFLVVANSYKLNPLTKEIFAFPDSKSGGIIPIVSTDGWNKLMTTHPDYKNHYYTEADKRVEMNKAKPCPEWIQIHIVKQDGSEVVVREYLDECFRDLTWANAWQTHTKRMLRHKAKIQGAREAFGFGGIYDQDEGERIIEAHVAEEEKIAGGGKPTVEEPKSLSEQKQEEKKDTPPKEEEPLHSNALSEAQIKKIYAVKSSLEKMNKIYNDEWVHTQIIKNFKVDSVKHLTKKQAIEFISGLIKLELKVKAEKPNSAA